jgi:hypothetical protein
LKYEQPVHNDIQDYLNILYQLHILCNSAWKVRWLYMRTGMPEKEATTYFKISQNSPGRRESVCRRVPLAKVQTQVHRESH